MDEWLDNSKGNKPGQVFVVKHFRDHKRLAMLPPRFPELRRLYHVSALRSEYVVLHADNIR